MRTGVRSNLTILGLLAAICLGVWLPLGDRLPDTGDRTVAPAGEDGRHATDMLAVAPFGDNRESYTTIRTFLQVVQLNFLSDTEIAAFRAGDASASRVVVASDLPEGKLVALVVKMSSRAAAIGTADRLTDIQLAAGFERVPDQPWLRRVETAGSEAGPPVGRVMYVHGDIVARVELTGRPGADLTGLGPLMARQLRVLPADG